jgi:hypothetical protein
MDTPHGWRTLRDYQMSVLVHLDHPPYLLEGRPDAYVQATYDSAVASPAHAKTRASPPSL